MKTHSKKAKKIVILGSTGSIGENALRVIATFPDQFQIIGLSAQHQAERILQQAIEFNVPHIALSNPESAKRCKEIASTDITVLSGIKGIEELAALP